MVAFKRFAVGVIAAAFLTSAFPAAAETLRLLTWGGYAPDAVVKKFKEETGIDVEVTFSNNEDIISKLRATGGAGFDLAQPSQDRITGPQTEFGIYKPIDLAKIDAGLFIPDLLEASKKNTTRRWRRSTGLPMSGAPPAWWSTAPRRADIKTFADLCKPEYKGKVSMRLKRTALLGMAFSAGQDPFAAYAMPPNTRR